MLVKAGAGPETEKGLFAKAQGGPGERKMDKKRPPACGKAGALERMLKGLKEAGFWGPISPVSIPCVITQGGAVLKEAA